MFAFALAPAAGLVGLGARLVGPAGADRGGVACASRPTWATCCVVGWLLLVAGGAVVASWAATPRPTGRRDARCWRSPRLSAWSLWSLPLWDQAARHPGNLGLIVDHLRHSDRADGGLGRGGPPARSRGSAWSHRPSAVPSPIRPSPMRSSADRRGPCSPCSRCWPVPSSVAPDRDGRRCASWPSPAAASSSGGSRSPTSRATPSPTSCGGSGRWSSSPSPPRLGGAARPGRSPARLDDAASRDRRAVGHRCGRGVVRSSWSPW